MLYIGIFLSRILSVYYESIEVRPNEQLKYQHFNKVNKLENGGAYWQIPIYYRNNL
ncbi:MAG: hypothetical protein LBE13_09685 [Bacteroidales bacterium]|jgi:hypothetical protein|nr:hypothetical protein [Bacteroidales bacterium]